MLCEPWHTACTCKAHTQKKTKKVKSFRLLQEKKTLVERNGEWRFWFVADFFWSLSASLIFRALSHCNSCFSFICIEKTLPQRAEVGGIGGWVRPRYGKVQCIRAWGCHNDVYSFEQSISASKRLKENLKECRTLMWASTEAPHDWIASGHFDWLYSVHMVWEGQVC